MTLKLVKLEPKYRRHLNDMMSQWYATGEKIVPYAIRRLDYRDFDNYLANLEQIRKAHELGVLDGVTTNPSLMAKENIRGTENCNRHYVEICRRERRGHSHRLRRNGARG